MKRATLVVYLALVFLSGVVVGGLGDRFFADQTVRAKGDDPRRQYVQEMRTRLKLRPDQTQRLTEILSATHARFRDVRTKWAPEVKAIQEGQQAEIRAMLDDSQRNEYEKMREERDKQRHNGR